MTIPLWILLGFAAWTLFLLLASIGFYRWSLILSGKREIASFRFDGTDGADWYQRATRAHANCLESLPVYGSIAVVARLAAVDAPLLDLCASLLLLARVLQSTTHVVFPQTNVIVLARFVFFFVQFVCMATMLVGILRLA